MLVALCAIMLAFSAAATRPSSAKAGDWAGECWITYLAKYYSCGQPWNYWKNYWVTSYPTSCAGVGWFEARNPNGDISGSSDWLDYNQTQHYVGWGYNKGFEWTLTPNCNMHIYVYAQTY